jgi:methylphosphotriester-DNA--protein-cysteine methyltransferase
MRCRSRGPVREVDYAAARAAVLAGYDPCPRCTRLEAELTPIVDPHPRARKKKKKKASSAPPSGNGVPSELATVS